MDFKKPISLLFAGMMILTQPGIVFAEPELTPFGAEKGANTDGTIPQWEGGITQPPAEYQPGKYHPDPYVDDKALFTIAHDNADSYNDKLSAGHQALLRQYPEYKMHVYPTRRSASSPSFIYDATAQNAKTATLDNDGNSIKNAITGIPFPAPKNGLEAIWNHLLRYRGTMVERDVDQGVVTDTGDYTIVKIHEEFYFPYGMPDAKLEDLKNIMIYFKQNISAPARLGGTLVLVHETFDKAKNHRQSWIYNAGLRRVSRAPFINYDSPAPSSDDLRTIDQFDMFNGAPDLYDWKLLGKQEMYVPYNSYRLQSNTLKNADLLKKNFINPEHTRYELHRVWKVEATLKKGKRHIYPRRIFYIDEDSWQILMSDIYDGRGDLWRFSEAHPINFYEVPVFFAASEIHYDLKRNRYLALSLHNETTPFDFSAKLNASDFTPQSLRQEGTR